MPLLPLWSKLWRPSGWSSLLKCDPTPRGGQHRPWDTCWWSGLLSTLVAGNKFQTLGWPFIKMSLETTEAIKESKGPLCSHHPGCGDLLDSTNKHKLTVWYATAMYQGDWGWLHLCLSRGRELLLNSHQEGRVQQALPKHCSIQQSHAQKTSSIQRKRPLRRGEGTASPFLTTCSTALRASPPETHGIMVTPFHLLLGNAPMSTLLSIPPGGIPFWSRNLPCSLLLPLPQQHDHGLSPQSKWWHNLPDWVEPPSPYEATSKVTPKEPPYSKQEGGNALP